MAGFDALLPRSQGMDAAFVLFGRLTMIKKAGSSAQNLVLV
jgi:hypothetical protein